MSDKKEPLVPKWVWVTNYDPKTTPDWLARNMAEYGVAAEQVAAGRILTATLMKAGTRGFLAVPRAEEGASCFGVYVEFEGWAVWFVRKNGYSRWTREQIVARAWGRNEDEKIGKQDDDHDWRIWKER